MDRDVEAVEICPVKKDGCVEIVPVDDHLKGCKMNCSKRIASYLVYISKMKIESL